ncbi:helix-turn-helix domain-containing protein [Alkalihalobacillus sp. MEB130]|uniref:helix-turn-helix domain-containing protein n=1 Tax=Alkalihalobacillus sp. MEB130 TaxID=2976704 RepID=UPI0028DDBC27|nr:helix-turn-helix domain-containing protein [Alkalihalobacillus sp. MEB130]MDT8860054.1 helix-turn-helix domain-containing protein [Alkalihalobacillus sp. MEB130]
METLTIRQAIIATVIATIQTDRTIYGIYHLLKGKKSAQTIQDGAFFGVFSYFGLFPKLERSDFENDISHLISNHLAIKIEEDRVKLTDYGQKELHHFQTRNHYVNDLRGWEYQSYAEEVWLRLSLFIQVISNLSVGERSFFPITHQTKIQQWVKQHLPKVEDMNKVSKQIHVELERFLSTCSNVQAAIFVHQLSGRGKIGLTRQQIAEQLHSTVEAVTVIQLSTIHRFILTMERTEAFPYLSIFVEGLKPAFVLTESAKQTFLLLEKGHTIEEISDMRKLKKNTIEDHVVEVAIQNPNFSIRPFVSEEEENLILHLAETLQTSRLRTIKEQIPKEVEYFMIRLVLARKKVENGT